MWPSTPAELEGAQLELAAARPAPWHPGMARPLIAGCFICFARGIVGRGRTGEPAWAAAVSMYGNRQQAGSACVRGAAGFDYEPGLLALREGPLLAVALAALPQPPEVIIVNATGRDHPRRAGLALQLGAQLDLPSVGVTDQPLLASAVEPAAERGASSPLLLDGMEVARAVRTRTGARALVVHPGWRTDMDTAVALVLGSIRRARTPEPLRRARRLARAARAAAAG